MSTDSTTHDTSTSAQKATIDYPADNELIIRRNFDAPRELVFAAITQPEHVREWYGMSTDGMLVCEIDFQVGGKWHYVLAGPLMGRTRRSPGSTWRSSRRSAWSAPSPLTTCPVPPTGWS